LLFKPRKERSRVNQYNKELVFKTRKRKRASELANAKEDAEKSDRLKSVFF
jgi:hypothetical protein